jgi:hypothetical protein
MSNPQPDKDKPSKDDGLKLEPETVKDLEVDDERTGAIRGGCSGSGTVSLNR